MNKKINFIEYSADGTYFLFAEQKSNAGETKYYTHSHPRHEIMFIVDGTVEYIVENRRHELKKGDVLLVKPELIHFAKRIISTPSTRYCIGFFPDAIQNAHMAKEIFDKGEHFTLPDTSVFCELVISLHHVISENRKNADIFSKNIIDAMIVSLYDEIRESNEKLPEHAPTNLQRIISYISSNLTTIHNMEEIAEALFFSKSYLGHLFKKEMGMGIMEYIRNKKVLRAHSLILTGAKPTEIYLECGFSNYPSFFNAYKAFFGFSPGAKTK